MKKVRLLDVDSRTGKFKLSRKVLMDKPEGYVERKPRQDRQGGGNRKPRRDNNNNNRR